MLVILENNWKRVLQEKQYILVTLILTICSVVAAIALTNAAETKGNLALVTSGNTYGIERVRQLEENPYFNIEVLTSTPSRSNLVQNRYDAIVTMSEEGTYQVESIKSDEFTGAISAFLENPASFVPNQDNGRKIGTNIIGYMLMFLLLQGVVYARLLFAEDKEKHMIERVVMSPIAFKNYLLGHAVFIGVMIFVPSFAVILVAQLVGVKIGLSLMAYAGLIATLSILTTGFSLMLNAFFQIADTANMLGTSIILLSSVLAGSFYSFSKEETVFDKIIHILPQKDFMDFVNAMEKGTLTNALTLHFLYVWVLAILFFVIAIVKTRKDYIYRR